MNFSRKQKNQILLSVNFVLLIIKLIKVFFYHVNLIWDEKIWCYSMPAILLLHFINSQNHTFQRIRDILLFLLTGAALGRTIGLVIKSESLFLPELIWLIFGIAAAFIHYSKSEDDKYQV